MTGIFNPKEGILVVTSRIMDQIVVCCREFLFTGFLCRRY